MSRFTLYLCLLVGLIIIVSVAAQRNNDAQLPDELPLQKCIKKVSDRCNASAVLGKVEECILAGVRKYCHGGQALS